MTVGVSHDPNGGGVRGEISNGGVFRGSVETRGEPVGEFTACVATTPGAYSG
jgi:hypothetical protein